MREKVKVATLQQQQPCYHQSCHPRQCKLRHQHKPDLSSRQINPQLVRTPTFHRLPRIRIKTKRHTLRMLPPEVLVGTTSAKKPWIPIRKSLVRKQRDYYLEIRLQPIGVDKHHCPARVTIPTSAQATTVVEEIMINPTIEYHNVSSSSSNHNNHINRFNQDHLQCEITPMSYPSMIPHPHPHLIHLPRNIHHSNVPIHTLRYDHRRHHHRHPNLPPQRSPPSP
mmetsp:Transcript_14566/g.26334  ORF Transcript_14566/g.26334 Transcript_14566/m.26334 type:complete len:224 (+) Transcript_14566:87-758(+)